MVGMGRYVTMTTDDDYESGVIVRIVLANADVLHIRPFSIVEGGEQLFSTRIDWGDGSENTVSTNEELTHAYSAGTWNIKIYGNIHSGRGVLPSTPWIFASGDYTCLKSIAGNISGIEARAFNGLTISADLDRVSDLEPLAFYNAYISGGINLPNLIFIPINAFSGMRQTSFSITIPNAEAIGTSAFDDCGVTNVIMRKKTKEQIKAMQNYPFGLSSSAVFTASDATFHPGE